MRTLAKGFALTLIATSILTLTACNDGKDDVAFDAAKANMEQKASYALGSYVATNIVEMQKQQKEYSGDLDQKLIVKGFLDSLDGKSVMTDDDIREAITKLDEKVQAKMMEKEAQDAKENLEKGQKFLEENKKKEGVVTTASGLQYKIIKEGKGAKPTTEDVIHVKYKGTTIDGTVFDEQKEPITLSLSQIIPGWIEGLQLMKEGSIFELYIPANLAYGENKLGESLKANSALIFNVELVKVEKPVADKAKATPKK